MPSGVYQRSEKQKQFMRELAQRPNKGRDNPNWKGDSIGYSGVHEWMNRSFGRPSECEACGTTSAKEFEWANTSGEYKRERSDWRRLCLTCHMKSDGRIGLIEFRGERKSMNEWAKHCGIEYATLRQRILKFKWPLERAFSVKDGRR